MTRGPTFPNSNHGMCGDPVTGPFDHEAGGKYATGQITRNYEEGGLLHVASAITTYHKGYVELRLCRYAAGTAEEERAALTEACLDKNVLKQADIPDAQMPGSRYYYLGNASDAGYSTDDPMMFYATYQLPSNLTCDGAAWKCVLQWHWVAGNTCNTPPLDKSSFKVTYLRDCGAEGFTGWPEEFFNCADIRVLPPGSPEIDTPDPNWPNFSQALFSGTSKTLSLSILALLSASLASIFALFII